MSEWKKCPIGEVVTLRQGFAINAKSKHYMSKEETSLPLLRIADMKNGTKEVFVKEEIPQRFIAHPEDIIYTRTGNVGLVFRNNYGVMHNNCFSVTPNDADELSRDFLYYALQNKTFFDTANALARGAAQPDLPHTSFNSIEFAYPSLFVQERIAYILSRYDSLIENYQKQIKLLEEAAQRLYKEWFIDLHFPGHENTNIIDGVPEGWEKKSVDSIYNIKYGKNLSTKLITETGFYPVYGANGVIGYYDKANCNEQVVLITSRGNGSGDVLMTYHKDAFITNNSFIVTPSEGFEYCKLPFTFQFLKMANFRAVRTGAAQPQLTNQSIHTVDVILPNKNLIEKFCSATIGMNDTIIKYREQIRLLTEARDRLLPKLMSGELTLEARAEKEDLLATPCKRGWEEDEAK